MIAYRLQLLIQKLLFWVATKLLDRAWEERVKNAKATFKATADQDVESAQQIFDTLIDNSAAYLKSADAALMGSQSTPGTIFGKFAKSKRQHALFDVSVKVIKKILPLANLVSVQPLKGPVGLVYTMKYSENEEGKASLSVLKNTVAAMTRKLQQTWSLEAAQDMQATHGIDIQAEICSAVANEIATEITTEIVTGLRKLGEANAIKVAFPAYIGNSTTGSLFVNIRRAASLIAARTRRGAGNFIITTPSVLTKLITEADSHFVSDKTTMLTDQWGLIYCGLLDERIKVYCSVGIPENTVIVGYKGKQVDTQVVYAPYIPIISTGVVMNPETYAPHVGFMTRYGMYGLTKDESNNSSDYYMTFDATPYI